MNTRICISRRIVRDRFLWKYLSNVSRDAVDLSGRGFDENKDRCRSFCYRRRGRGAIAPLKRTLPNGKRNLRAANAPICNRCRRKRTRRQISTGNTGGIFFLRSRDDQFQTFPDRARLFQRPASTRSSVKVDWKHRRRIRRSFYALRVFIAWEHAKSVLSSQRWQLIKTKT